MVQELICSSSVNVKKCKNTRGGRRYIIYVSYKYKKYNTKFESTNIKLCHLEYYDKNIFLNTAYYHIKYNKI